MTRFVVDASVAVKWFVPEIHSNDSLRLLDERHELFAPDLLIPEFGNIVWKKIQLGEVDEILGSKILLGLQAAPIELYLSEKVMRSAFELSVSTGRTFYDSLYVAGALHLSCQLVTADKRLINGLAQSDVRDSVVFVGDLPSA